MPSYEQNKSSKLWSVRFREVDGTGESHQKRLSGYKTKKEAQYGYQDYLAQKAEEEKKAAPVESPDDMLFDNLVLQFLKYKETRVKVSVLYDLRNRIESRITPIFSGRTVGSIKPVDVLRWQQDLSNEYSYQYVLKLTNTMVSIYNYGAKYHDITNVMTKVDRPRNTEPKKEMVVWTPEEFVAFHDCVAKPEHALYFLCLYITGMRRGECSALMWEDFDPISRTLKISKSVTNKGKQKAWEITTPKNQGSNRTITIPQFLCDQLLAHKETAPSGYFIFCGERPFATTTIDKAFQKAIREAEVPDIRIHDLRHSCASLLISKGVSIVGVSHHLGHKDVTQTLNTYSHLMPDDHSKIVAELEKVGTLI